MILLARLNRFAALATLAMTATMGPAMADCAPLVRRFEQAVAARSIDAAKTAAGDFDSDIVCGERAEEFKTKYVQFLIGLAETPSIGEAERRHALEEAEKTVLVTGTWRTAASLGDTYFRLRDRPRAFKWYEKSLAFLTSRPGAGASPAEKQSLVEKAGAAKSGVSADRPGQEQWLQSNRELDGKVAGIYSPGLIREVEVLSVPLPIQFFTNEARFTPEGKAAVKELADAAKEQNLQSLKLVGHADPRGTATYNSELSHHRVEAVRDALVRDGVHAHITIEWKGSQQPFDVKVLPYTPTQEEIWALDRRVEWVRDGASK